MIDEDAEDAEDVPPPGLPSAARVGGRVWLTFDGRTTEAIVVLASGNGRSLMLGFDGLLGPYLGMLPIRWDAPRGVYLDLIGARNVTVTPWPS